MQKTIRQFMGILPTTVAMILLPTGYASAEITSFTGGDPGEGLDLQGTFVYALNFAETQPANDIVTVQDAPFQRTRNPTPVPAGVGYDAFWNYDELPVGEYGDTANDNNLEILLDSAANAHTDPGTTNITITLSNLVSQTYQLQLLISPLSATDRIMDIYVEGVLQDTVNVDTDTFGADTGALFSGLFEISDGAMDIVLARGAGTVNTPILSALTLKLIETIEFTRVDVVDTVLLGFPTLSGSLYRVEATPDLVSSNYTDLGLSLTGDGGTNYLFDPGTASGASTNRSYRILKMQ